MGTCESMVFRGMTMSSRSFSEMAGNCVGLRCAARPAPSSSELRAKPQPSSPSTGGSLAGWRSSTFCTCRRRGRSEALRPTSWHIQHSPRKVLPPLPPPP
eukprot:10638909-Alexandrium_andersonii.AAC.1